MDDVGYRVAFSRIRGIGPARFAKLVEYFGDAGSAWEASEKELTACLGPALTRSFCSERVKIDPEAELKDICQRGYRLLVPGERGYPPLLHHVHAPPFLLYQLGEFDFTDDLVTVAMVGTRRPTPYGRKVAREFARYLAREGIVVGSGMALGIDGESHRGALEGGGRTVAVLGSGLDVVYPSSHLDLARDITSSGGALITEYPPGTRARRENFPARNRILSGMSQGTLIVEAPEKSGTMITAGFALEQGREVMAVPGPVTSPMSRGTNILLSQGAYLVQGPKDVLVALGITVDEERQEDGGGERHDLTPEEKEILTHIDPVGVTREELLHLSGWEEGRLYRVLVGLELKGCIRQALGGKLCSC